MAVELAPTAHFTRLFSGGVSGGVSGTNQTQGGWFRVDTQSPGDIYRVLFALDSGATNWMGLYLGDEGAGMRLEVWNNNFDAAKVVGPLVPLSTWYYVAAVRAGSNWTMYWRSEEEATLSSAVGTVEGTISPNNLRVAAESTVDVDTTLDGALAYWRVHSSALSSGAVLSESASTTAVATPWADWPFVSAATSTNDQSGNSRPLTFTSGSGSQSTVADPSISIGGGSMPPVPSNRYQRFTAQ